MSLLFLTMIVVIIILLTKNKDLKDQNDNLKTNTVNYVNFCPKCGYNFRNSFNRLNFCPNCGHNFIPNSQVNVTQNNINSKKEVNKPTEKEIKNSLVLTVGAVLVVISAIAFLSSTWSVTSNFIKTFILFLMLIVFWGFSYIADVKLKLKQTAKTFYYISLAYIPIVLLSISMFSLFGNYLSLNGEGKYIYLTISSIAVSIIYYFNLDKRKGKILFTFNIIFEVLSVIFFTLIFTSKFSFILLGLILYSLLISILYLNKKIYYSEKAHKVLSSVLCLSLSGIILFENFINNIINNIFEADVILFAIMLINIYLVLVKILNKDNIYKFIYPIVIVLTFNNLSKLFDENMMFAQSLILASFVFAYLYNLAKEHQINLITYLEVLCCFSIFYFNWLFTSIFVDNLLPNYILFIVLLLLSLVHYVFNNKYRTLSSVMIAISTILASISLCVYFEFNSIVLGLIAFILILISMFKNVNINLRNGFKWVGIISLFIITLLFGYDVSIYSLILCSIYSVIVLGYGIINKDDFYKIFSYVYINEVLLYVFDFAQIDYSLFIIPATTVILTIVERLISNIRSKSSDVYLIISYILSTLLLLDTIGNYNNIAMLILSLSFVYYVIYYKKNINYLCVPFIGMIPHIYFSYNLIINNFNFMYIISILVLIGIMALMYYKKKNLYITMFFIYSYFHLSCLEEIKYISIFILIVGSFICYLIKSNKVKDTYKALIYILCLVFYNTVLTDLGFGNMISLSAISYIGVLILITRTIFKKYGNGYKVWEYVISILINLIVIGSLTSEYDGIIYFIFLAILIIISYIYKLGPIFLISLISIVLNSIILTQTIFGNIPWWIYILVIGGILIGFAIHNEAKDKNEKETIKDRLDL